MRTDHSEGVGQADALHVLNGSHPGGLEHAFSALTPHIVASLYRKAEIRDAIPGGEQPPVSIMRGIAGGSEQPQ